MPNKVVKAIIEHRDLGYFAVLFGVLHWGWCRITGSPHPFSRSYGDYVRKKEEEEKNTSIFSTEMLWTDNDMNSKR